MDFGSPYPYLTYFITINMASEPKSTTIGFILSILNHRFQKFSQGFENWLDFNVVFKLKHSN